MKVGKTMAALALATLVATGPTAAAKDLKLPRCNGQKKRPANPYGTVLPVLPDRPSSAASASQGVPRGTPQASAPPINLFPDKSVVDEAGAPAAPTPTTGAAREQVPAIQAVPATFAPQAALRSSFPSCA